MFGLENCPEAFDFAHSLVYLPLLVLVNMAICHDLVGDLLKLLLSRENVFIFPEGVELFHCVAKVTLKQTD